MEKHPHMGHRVPTHTVLSSGDRGNRSSNYRRPSESTRHGDSRDDSRSSRSELNSRANYWTNTTALPIWYHIGTVTIALIIVVIAIALGIAGG